MDSKENKPREVEVYIDGTDWRYEVGEASDGNTVYPSLESIQHYTQCWKGCGVVKCKLVFVEEVLPEDTKEMFKDLVPASQLTQDRDVARLQSAEYHLEFMNKRVENIKVRIEELKKKIEEKK